MVLSWWVVVKESFDIYEMICGILPGQSVPELRSKVCKYLTANLDYFGNLFQEEFGPKETNMYDYIGKQVRTTTVPDHNAVFALGKMLKESFFIIVVRHNWRQLTLQILILYSAMWATRNFTPSPYIWGLSSTLMFEQVKIMHMWYVTTLLAVKIGLCLEKISVVTLK